VTGYRNSATRFVKRMMKLGVGVATVSEDCSLERVLDSKVEEIIGRNSRASDPTLDDEDA
jgi:hypothetical protein